MSDWQDNIDDLMDAFGQLSRDRPNDPPLSDDDWALSKSLISEETNELLDAIDDRDVVEIADGIIDSLVVIIGLASRVGIAIEPLWDIVQENNMSKIGGPIDPVTGKQLKPDGWVPPDLRTELIDQGWIPDDDE